jgi:hypothetical protein
MDVYTKKDLTYIAILVLISLAIGVYLIATTVIISRDGVTYIECSQALSSDFDALIKDNLPIGYSLLVAGFHRVYSAVYNSAEPASWIISAQICTLTCKTLAMVAFYFFGRCFFPSKYVFTGLVILTFLPYPAEYGSDALRDWPHALFLFAALFFLQQGVRQSSGLYLGLAGLVCGLGQVIRPECAQVVLYGIIIFCFKLGRSFFKDQAFPQKHVYLLLAAGFLIIFIPYSLKREKLIPKRLKTLLTSSPLEHRDTDFDIASPSHANVLDAGIELAKTVMEYFHYYFVLPAAIGVYLRYFRKKKWHCEINLLIGLFIGFYCAALLVLHSTSGYISKRHVLPLCVVLSFYILPGAIAMGSFIITAFKGDSRHLKKVILILILGGMIACLPKLLRPIGADKRVYRQAANWIESHTAEGDRFMTFDARLPFYSNRKHWKPFNKKNRRDMTSDYLICLAKDGQLDMEISADYVLAKCLKVNQRGKEIKIYQRVD